MVCRLFQGLRRPARLLAVALLAAFASVLITAPAYGSTTFSASLSCDVFDHTLTGHAEVDANLADDYPYGAWILYRFLYWQVDQNDQKISPTNAVPAPGDGFQNSGLWQPNGGYFVAPKWIDIGSYLSGDSWIQQPVDFNGDNNLPHKSQVWYQGALEVYVWPAYGDHWIHYNPVRAANLQYSGGQFDQEMSECAT